MLLKKVWWSEATGFIRRVFTVELQGLILWEDEENRKCHFERSEKFYRTEVLEFPAFA